MKKKKNQKMKMMMLVQNHQAKNHSMIMLVLYQNKDVAGKNKYNTDNKAKKKPKIQIKNPKEKRKKENKLVYLSQQKFIQICNMSHYELNQTRKLEILIEKRKNTIIFSVAYC